MKRGVGSRGFRQAISFALEGTCDAHLQRSPGVGAPEAHSAASDSTVSRFIVANGVITSDELTAGGLRAWLTGHDPVTGGERGHQRLSPDADLLLDGTLHHPKSQCIAALLDPEFATEFEGLQDRLRERILLTWQTELNARRGYGGSSARRSPASGPSSFSIDAHAGSTRHPPPSLSEHQGGRRGRQVVEPRLTYRRETAHSRQRRGRTHRPHRSRLDRGARAAREHAR